MVDEVYIDEKVRRYEEFLNERLRKDLEIVFKM